VLTRNDEQGGVSVRLVRLERQQSRVADDIRAALASLGRGSTVIGGIALVGVGTVTERPIEAVVVLPHGVIIVIGVDLPDPALRLEAPLGAPWKADGWPLVADDDAVNPATEALDMSQTCERRIAELVPGTAPVGTIVAVGPYVETVDQPPTDLAGPVRVLHPTPTTMLAATVSLATAHRPRSVDQVRALIRGLAPSAPEFSDEVLLGEGFSRLTDDAPPESSADSGAPAGSASVSAADSVAVSAGATSTTTTSAADSPIAGSEPGAPESPAAAADSPAAGPGPSAPESAAAAASAANSPTTDPNPTTPESATPGSAAAAPVTAPASTDWRTETPLRAEPEPAGDSASEPAVEAEPAESDPEPPAAAEADLTEVVPPAAQEEPGRPADSPARPVFPGTESVQPPRLPGSTPPGDPEPAEPSSAEAERTGTRGFPAEAKPTGSRPAEPAPPPATPQPSTGAAPRPETAPAPVASRTVRWLPLGAIGALVVLVVAAIVVATTGDGTAAAPAGPSPSVTPPPPSSSSSAAAPVRSLQFALRAAGGDQRCASHAFGDAQASLQQTSCSGVRRASYAATVDGRAGAVTVGVVEFADAAQAAAFKAVADTPGGGGVLDLATETGQWGATPVPRFENAAYASKLDGASVRLVQAVWAPGPSTADDPGLVRAAKAALDLPAS
jgi:hypothetical protein